MYSEVCTGDRSKVDILILRFIFGLKTNKVLLLHQYANDSKFSPSNLICECLVLSSIQITVNLSLFC